MSPDGPTGPNAQSARIIVSAEEAGRRLDHVLTSRFEHLSRSQIQRLIRTGLVRIDGRPAKSGTSVTSGVTVAVTLPEPVAAVPKAEDIPLTVVYDDADLAVVNKPAGMVVHPAAGHPSGTLVNALLHHVSGLSGIGGEERPGIVHRLDKGTSGLMVVAKNDATHRALSRQFHDRAVGKEYVALVWGTPEAGRLVSSPIGRDPTHRARMSSRSTRVRPAVTRLLSVERLKGVALVRVAIATGRTHQIRVHLSEIGHPVVGDELYGGVRRHLPMHLRGLLLLDRPFLHAARLSFTHPADGSSLTFEAPLPADLSGILAGLAPSRITR
jgi:23S rRNA pseudouridine1911/1915/1917 synthase